MNDMFSIDLLHYFFVYIDILLYAFIQTNFLHAKIKKFHFHQFFHIVWSILNVGFFCNWKYSIFLQCIKINKILYVQKEVYTHHLLKCHNMRLCKAVLPPVQLLCIHVNISWPSFHVLETEAGFISVSLSWPLCCVTISAFWGFKWIKHIEGYFTLLLDRPGKRETHCFMTAVSDLDIPS